MIPRKLATAADFSALTSSLNAFYTNKARAETISVAHSTDTNDTVDSAICEVEELVLPSAVIPDRREPVLESTSHSLTENTADDDHLVKHPLPDSWHQESFPNPAGSQEQPEEWKLQACSQTSNQNQVITTTDDMQIHSRQCKEESISSIILSASDQAGRGPSSRHSCAASDEFTGRLDGKDIPRKKDHDHPILTDIVCDEKAPDETANLHMAEDATGRQASNSAIDSTPKVDSAGDLACSRWAGRATEPKIDSVGTGIASSSRFLESKNIISLSEHKWSQPPQQQESRDVRGPPLAKIEAIDKIKSKVKMISLTNTSTTSTLTMAEKLVLIQQGRGIARLKDSFMPLQIRNEGSVNKLSAVVEHERSHYRGSTSGKCANDKKIIRYSREFLMSFRHLTTPPRCIESVMATIHGEAGELPVRDDARKSTLAADIRSMEPDQALPRSGKPNDAPSENVRRSSNTSSVAVSSASRSEIPEGRLRRTLLDRLWGFILE
ncbi:hypothetical protein BGX21_003491 [Mortierella sp. AD011]|nr:hypothetical protein BGX20_006826 [Mortierella sp. AD010]KAF9376456.1 hypothetical protein BGX21_003491 [Mortierella sp. AD011]